MSQPRSFYKDVSEKDWQDQVLETLAYAGWKVAHFRTAQQGGRYMTPVQADGAGFPDLLCIRPRDGDHFVTELKREYGPATPQQIQWLAWFELAGWDTYIWRPSDVDEMIARVTRSAG